MYICIYRLTTSFNQHHASTAYQTNEFSNIALQYAYCIQDFLLNAIHFTSCMHMDLELITKKTKKTKTKTVKANLLVKCKNYMYDPRI